MPISLVQQGVVTEFLFAVFAILGSGGALEVARQVTDDDRRDADVHRRHDFLINLGFQIKSALSVRRHGASQVLFIQFIVRKERLISDRAFWYLFAHLDARMMTLADPVFLVPSAEVHQHALPQLHGDTWTFHFEASLSATSHDRWQPYRVAVRELGKRILAIIDEMERAQSTPRPVPDALDHLGLTWVRRTSGLVVPEHVAA